MLLSISSCFDELKESYFKHDIENSQKSWEVIFNYIQDLSKGMDVKGYTCNPLKIEKNNSKPRRILFVDRLWNGDTTHSTSLIVFLLTYQNNEDDFYIAEV